MPSSGRGFLGLFHREDKEMPFLEHLEELRRVVIRSIGVFLVAVIGCYFVSGWLLDKIAVRMIGEVTFLRPMEAFNARLKVAALIGLLLALPFILAQIWGFVVPGLLHKERRAVAPIVFWSVLLFYAGGAFGYLLVTPTVLRLLVGLGTAHVHAQIAVGYLLDFILTLTFASAVLFELPVVVAILSMIEVLTPDFLIKRWRHAIVIIFIITAVVTPGDVAVSQVVMAVPIMMLYFGSILVSKAIWRAKKKSGRDGGSITEVGGGDRAG